MNGIDSISLLKSMHHTCHINICTEYLYRHGFLLKQPITDITDNFGLYSGKLLCSGSCPIEQVKNNNCRGLHGTFGMLEVRTGSGILSYRYTEIVVVAVAALILYIEWKESTFVQIYKLKRTRYANLMRGNIYNRPSQIAARGPNPAHGVKLTPLYTYLC